jgi:hypothetical protein
VASFPADTRLARPPDEIGLQEESLQQQQQHHQHPDPDDFNVWEEDDDVNTGTMPFRSPFHRTNDAHSQQPLLKEDGPQRESNTFAESHERFLERPHMSRRSTFRSRTPDVEDKNLTRRKYILASGFLLLSLISFVIQTETAVYIQHELHWDKPYCMLYVIPLPVRLLSSSNFFHVLDILPTAPGRYYGRRSSSSFEFKNENCPGTLSGEDMYSSCARQPRWWNGRTCILPPETTIDRRSLIC